MIGSLSPTKVCMRVTMPLMKKMVLITRALSSSVPPMAGTIRKGISTVDPSMVRYCCSTLSVSMQL